MDADPHDPGRPRHELSRAVAALKAAGCDAALLSSVANVTYASGWEVPVPLGALAEMSYGIPLLLIAVSDASAHLIVPNAPEGAARRVAAVDGVLPFDTFDSFAPADSRASWLDAVRQALLAAGIGGGRGTLAIERRSLPVAVAEVLDSALPGWRLEDAEAPLAAARSIKTDREIDLLRRTAHLADISHNTLAGLCHEPGQTEYAMFAEISAAIFAGAGREIPLSGELVTGPRTTTVLYPNGPRERTTERGDAALMDLSGRFDGYWFDCANTHLIGGVGPSAEQRRYAKASQDACEAAMAALKPGALACDAAAAAEAAFTAHGLPMAHYAGHQIGVTVNEQPRLVPYDRTPIAAGMVFSVEPGAYQGPGGTFGARSEKMVLVSDSGPEILSRFSWGIE